MEGLNLKICAQNINSLGATNANSGNFKKKVVALKNLKADVLLITDTRINVNKDENSLKKVKAIFEEPFGGSYKIVVNSDKKNRGVVFAYKSELNMLINRVWGDNFGNILVVDCNIAGKDFSIIGVYGPNNLDLEFCNNLEEVLKKRYNLEKTTIVVAGDFNTVMDKSETNLNRDLLYAKTIPNKLHGFRLNDFCLKYDLVDLYRYLHPEKREYTYKHLSEKRASRSRLDFALVSKKCANCNISCEIGTKIHSSADHLPVVVTFTKAKIRNIEGRNSKVFESTLQHWLVDGVVFFEFFDTFLFHANIPEFCKDIFKSKSGKLCKALFELKKNYIDATKDDERLLTSESYKNLSEIIDSAPPLEFFEAIEIKASSTTFYEIVIGKINNALLDLQKRILRKNREREVFLKSKINNLRMGGNYEECESFEKLLDDINQTKLLDRLREREHFL